MNKTRSCNEATLDRSLYHSQHVLGGQ